MNYRAAPPVRETRGQGRANRMNPAKLILALLVATASFLSAADKPAKPPLKITPGQVIIPFDKMRRIWGELISVDLATRTGTFRAEGDDTIMRFTAMPYAEMLHHATFGDLRDFRIGERAIFRLHVNEAGEWFWLTYIQDEMNMLNGHQEYFFIDRIDAAKHEFTCTWAKHDRSFIRETNVVIRTDADTRFWKGGRPAKFADLKVGDTFRPKTRGIGQGRVRVCWEVFLDDESLLKFQAEQKAVHLRRMTEEGLPGYVDQAGEGSIELTLFHEGEDFTRQLKAGHKVRLAPAGVDRKPTAQPIPGTISTAKMTGKNCKVTLTVNGPTTAFKPTELARVWVGGK